MRDEFLPVVLVSFQVVVHHFSTECFFQSCFRKGKRTSPRMWCVNCAFANCASTFALANLVTDWREQPRYKLHLCVLLKHVLLLISFFYCRRCWNSSRANNPSSPRPATPCVPSVSDVTKRLLCTAQYEEPRQRRFLKEDSKSGNTSWGRTTSVTLATLALASRNTLILVSSTIHPLVSMVWTFMLSLVAQVRFAS